MRKDSFYMNMITKIEETLSFIRKYKFDAEKYGGFKLMFSGGKDSQVLYDLMKKSGVKFTAYYCVTTNDPPENVYFIRKEYPDVIVIAVLMELVFYECHKKKYRNCKNPQESDPFW